MSTVTGTAVEITEEDMDYIEESLRNRGCFGSSDVSSEPDPNLEAELDAAVEIAQIEADAAVDIAEAVAEAEASVGEAVAEAAADVAEAEADTAEAVAEAVVEAAEVAAVEEDTTEDVMEDVAPLTVEDEVEAGNFVPPEDTGPLASHWFSRKLSRR